MNYFIFRNLAMNRAPDTYVKLCLVSSNGQEMARSKTSVRRGQPNPLFKETFVFQVSTFINLFDYKEKILIKFYFKGCTISISRCHINDIRV